MLAGQSKALVFGNLGMSLDNQLSFSFTAPLKGAFASNNQQLLHSTVCLRMFSVDASGHRAVLSEQWLVNGI